MIKLNYKKEDEDLKFILHAFDQTAVFIKDQSLILESDKQYTDLDSIIEQLFKICSEEFSQKKLNEFKRLRKTPIVPKMEFSILNLLCYFNIVKDMLLTGNLKNKISIDQYTLILKEKNIKFDPEFYMLEIRSGKILSISEAEGMDKLYCENVLADKEYFICSGLRTVYEKKDLENNVYLFLLNIKKAKFKNLMSEGMICCTEGEGVEAIKVDVSEGIRIELEGYLRFFEDLEYGKVDLTKSAYKNILSEFKIVEHKLCFKNVKVKIGEEYVITKTKEGPVR